MREDRIDALLDRRRFDWQPVGHGESGDSVFRRGDGQVYAKLAATARSAELAGERDRLTWLADRGVGAPRLLDWRMADGDACLLMSAVAGVRASVLPRSELLAAWPSIVHRIRALHALPSADCPFDRGLSTMSDRAADVVARGALNADFLSPADKKTSPASLLARLARELPTRLAQEPGDRVVCHGDACLPNLMVDPHTLQITGLIDVGRLGTADRYVDLTLMLASAVESWDSPRDADHAFAILFETLEIDAPDHERLAFYLALDPLTWG